MVPSDEPRVKGPGFREHVTLHVLKSRPLMEFFCTSKPTDLVDLKNLGTLTSPVPTSPSVRRGRMGGGGTSDGIIPIPPPSRPLSSVTPRRPHSARPATKASHRTESPLSTPRSKWPSIVSFHPPSGNNTPAANHESDVNDSYKIARVGRDAASAAGTRPSTAPSHAGDSGAPPNSSSDRSRSVIYEAWGEGEEGEEGDGEGFSVSIGPPSQGVAEDGCTPAENGGRMQWKRRYFTLEQDANLMEGPMSFEVKLIGQGQGGTSHNRDHLTWYYSDFLDKSEDDYTRHPEDEDGAVELEALIKWLNSFTPRSRVDGYPMLVIALDCLNKLSAKSAKVEWAENKRLLEVLQGLELKLATYKEDEEKRTAEKELGLRLNTLGCQASFGEPELEKTTALLAEAVRKAEVEKELFRAKKQECLSLQVALTNTKKEMQWMEIEHQKKVKQLEANAEYKVKIREDMYNQQRMRKVARMMASDHFSTYFRIWKEVMNKRLDSIRNIRSGLIHCLGFEKRASFHEWVKAAKRRKVLRQKFVYIEMRTRRRAKLWVMGNLVKNIEVRYFERLKEREVALRRRVLMRTVGSHAFLDLRVNVRWERVIGHMRDKICHRLVTLSFTAMRVNVFENLKERSESKVGGSRRASTASSRGGSIVPSPRDSVKMRAPPKIKQHQPQTGGQLSRRGSVSSLDSGKGGHVVKTQTIESVVGSARRGSFNLDAIRSSVHGAESPALSRTASKQSLDSRSNSPTGSIASSTAGSVKQPTSDAELFLQSLNFRATINPMCTTVLKLPDGNAADSTLQLNSTTCPAAKTDPAKAVPSRSRFTSVERPILNDQLERSESFARSGSMAMPSRPGLNSLDRYDPWERPDSISRAGSIAVSARPRSFDSNDSNSNSFGRFDTQDLLESDDSTSSHSRFWDPDVDKIRRNASETNMEEILRRAGSDESEEMMSRLSSGGSDIGILRRRSSGGESGNEGSSGGRAAGRQPLVPLTPIQDSIDEEVPGAHGNVSPLVSPTFRGGRGRFNSIQEDELLVEDAPLEGGAQVGLAGGAEAE